MKPEHVGHSGFGLSRPHSNAECGYERRDRLRSADWLPVPQTSPLPRGFHSRSNWRRAIRLELLQGGPLVARKTRSGRTE